MEFKLGELFCGPGGLAFGASLAKVEKNGEKYSISSVWANDIHKDSCNTFRENISKNKKIKIYCEDIRTIDISKFPDSDALSFGFPCNDFSVVGKQKGVNGHYGPLYTYGVKVIKKHKPKWFLAENVGGLKNANDGNTFKKILYELYQEGYNLVPHLYNFADYGVPQARKRIIIVGIRKDFDLFFKVPAITHKINITCKEALENPPISKESFNNEYTRQSKQVIERLKYIKPGENAFTAKIPKKLRLKINGAKISQIYKRLDPKKPAYTITGSGGGGTHVYHWKENRALTNRERARIQTFPDDFIFLGSKENVRKQIGMAVPPKGVKIIFESILKTFAGINYKSIKPNIVPLFHNYSLPVELKDSEIKPNIKREKVLTY